VLNLGQTIGHAVEWWQARRGEPGTGYSHGEAVAIGIVQAARLSEALGVCRRGLAAQLEADFAAAGLPTACPVSPSEIRQAIAKDKKAEGGSVNFVLIEDIGKVEVRLLPVDRIVQLLETANL
jgi:3-dehydroquinate synthetase